MNAQNPNPEQQAHRSAQPHSGSCLCGAIRYEIRGELGPIVLCHCAQCRKAQGSAFASNAAVKATDFRNSFPYLNTPVPGAKF